MRRSILPGAALALPGIVAAAAMPTAVQRVELALRNQWAQGSLPLPTEAVGIGSTWDST